MNGAGWSEALRLLDRRRAIAHLLPSAIADLAELQELENVIRQCTAAGITPLDAAALDAEDQAQRLPPGPGGQ